jgi:hypothetical protein
MFLVAQMKDVTAGGIPEEFVRFRSQGPLRITIVDTVTGVSKELQPTDGHFASHQTAQAVLMRVINAGPTFGTLKTGTGQTVARFGLRGTVPTGIQLRIEQLLFTPSISSGLTVTNWRLGTADGATSMPCSMGSDGFVNCVNIDPTIGTIANDTLLTLSADIAIKPSASQGQSLQVSLVEPGSLSTLGSVQWSDGSGHYRWMDQGAPVAEGTLWTQ